MYIGWTIFTNIHAITLYYIVINMVCHKHLLYKYCVSIGYSIPGHSIWKRIYRGEAEIHSFLYTNDQVLYNQFSPYFLCRVSWLPIITNIGSLSTGTCFIQKKYMPPPLSYLKEEEGAYIFWMKQVPVILSQIRLNEYQLKSISFNYNIQNVCGIWKIFNNTRQRKYGLIYYIYWNIDLLQIFIFELHVVLFIWAISQNHWKIVYS
jgi:hypothetical protein